jgi:hypothetical protein
VRVGDTVQVLGDISNGWHGGASDWVRVERIRFDRPRGSAEISVRVLDTTVLLWPAGVRRIDAKENQGRPLRQQTGGVDDFAERSSNAAYFERLAVECDSVENWDVMGNDSTKIKRADAQSGWVKAGDVTVSLLCAQPATNAEGTSNCLVQSVERVGGTYCGRE